MGVWVEKFKRLVRAFVILLLAVVVLTPATLVITFTLAIINLENPIKTFKDVDEGMGLIDLYKSFIPHIKSILRGV